MIRSLVRSLAPLLLMPLAACTRSDVVPATTAGIAGDTAARDSAAVERDSAARDGTQGVVGCSADARAGITITASDARTGAALAGFTVVLREAAEGDGARQRAGRASARALDSVVVAGRPPVPPPPIVWAGASERPGRYALRVTKRGYRPWDSTGVVVAREGCHVKTVRLDVRLQPE